MKYFLKLYYSDFSDYSLDYGPYNNESDAYKNFYGLEEYNGEYTDELERINKIQSYNLKYSKLEFVDEEGNIIKSLNRVDSDDKYHIFVTGYFPSYFELVLEETYDDLDDLLNKYDLKEDNLFVEYYLIKRLFNDIRKKYKNIDVNGIAVRNKYGTCYSKEIHNLDERYVVTRTYLDEGHWTSPAPIGVPIIKEVFETKEDLIKYYGELSCNATWEEIIERLKEYYEIPNEDFVDCEIWKDYMNYEINIYDLYENKFIF